MIELSPLLKPHTLFMLDILKALSKVNENMFVLGR